VGCIPRRWVYLKVFESVEVSDENVSIDDKRVRSFGLGPHTVASPYPDSASSVTPLTLPSSYPHLLTGGEEFNGRPPPPG
jgi:hypothetical protein